MCYVCGRYLGPDYGDFNKPDGEVTAADLPKLAHESFPLCMLVWPRLCDVHRPTYGPETSTLLSPQTCHPSLFAGLPFSSTSA